MQGIADFETGKMENKLRRNVVGRAQNLDFVAHDVQNAAAFQARAFAFALERHRHGGGNLAVGVET